MIVHIIAYFILCEAFKTVLMICSTYVSFKGSNNGCGYDQVWDED